MQASQWLSCNFRTLRVSKLIVQKTPTQQTNAREIEKGYTFFHSLRLTVQVPLATHSVCTKSAEAATHSGKTKAWVLCVFSHSHWAIQAVRALSRAQNFSICCKKKNASSRKISTKVCGANLCRRDKCERLLHFRGRAAFFCCPEKEREDTPPLWF